MATSHPEDDPQLIADLALGDRLAPQASRTPDPAASELPTVEPGEAELPRQGRCVSHEIQRGHLADHTSGRDAPVDGPVSRDLFAPALERHSLRSRWPGISSHHPVRLLAWPGTDLPGL